MRTDKGKKSYEGPIGIMNMVSDFVSEAAKKQEAEKQAANKKNQGNAKQGAKPAVVSATKGGSNSKKPGQSKPVLGPPAPGKTVVKDLQLNPLLPNFGLQLDHHKTPSAPKDLFKPQAKDSVEMQVRKKILSPQQKEPPKNIYTSMPKGEFTPESKLLKYAQGLPKIRTTHGVLAVEVPGFSEMPKSQQDYYLNSITKDINKRGRNHLGKVYMIDPTKKTSGLSEKQEKWREPEKGNAPQKNDPRFTKGFPQIQTNQGTMAIHVPGYDQMSAEQQKATRLRVANEINRTGHSTTATPYVIDRAVFVKNTERSMNRKQEEFFNVMPSVDKMFLPTTTTVQTKRGLVKVDIHNFNQMTLDQQNKARQKVVNDINKAGFTSNGRVVGIDDRKGSNNKFHMDHQVEQVIRTNRRGEQKFRDHYEAPAKGMEGKKGPVRLKIDDGMGGKFTVRFEKPPTNGEIMEARDQYQTQNKLKKGQLSHHAVNKIADMRFDAIEFTRAVDSSKGFLKQKGGDAVVRTREAAMDLAEKLGLRDYRVLLDPRSPEFKALKKNAKVFGYTEDSLEKNLEDAGVSGRDAGLIRRNPGMEHDNGWDTMMRSVNTAMSPVDSALTLMGDVRSNEERAKSKIKLFGVGPEISESTGVAVADLLINVAAGGGIKGLSQGLTTLGTRGAKGLASLGSSGLKNLSKELGKMSAKDLKALTGQIASKLSGNREALNILKAEGVEGLAKRLSTTGTKLADKFSKARLKGAEGIKEAYSTMKAPFKLPQQDVMRIRGVSSAPIKAYKDIAPAIANKLKALGLNFKSEKQIAEFVRSLSPEGLDKISKKLLGQLSEEMTHDLRNKPLKELAKRVGGVGKTVGKEFVQGLVPDAVQTLPSVWLQARDRQRAGGEGFVESILNSAAAHGAGYLDEHDIRRVFDSKLSGDEKLGTILNLAAFSGGAYSAHKRSHYDRLRDVSKKYADAHGRDITAKQIKSLDKPKQVENKTGNKALVRDFLGAVPEKKRRDFIKTHGGDTAKMAHSIKRYVRDGTLPPGMSNRDMEKGRAGALGEKEMLMKFMEPVTSSFLNREHKLLSGGYTKQVADYGFQYAGGRTAAREDEDKQEGPGDPRRPTYLEATPEGYASAMRGGKKDDKKKKEAARR